MIHEKIKYIKNKHKHESIFKRKIQKINQIDQENDQSYETFG